MMGIAGACDGGRWQPAKHSAKAAKNGDHSLSRSRPLRAPALNMAADAGSAVSRSFDHTEPEETPRRGFGRAFPEEFVREGPQVLAGVLEV